MLLEFEEYYVDPRKINQVVRCLQADGTIIYPTDAVYGLGCDIFSKKAVEDICRIRSLDPRKAMLTFICQDIRQVAEYAVPIDNQVFKLMKKNWPGPVTFILRANGEVPKLFKNNKKTIGVRVPENEIAQQILQTLGRPILSLSLKSDDLILEYPTDPFEIFEHFQHEVDIVIDGGAGSNVPSAVLDCTGNEVVVVREGVREIVW
ncbi:MAG: L-threonylcarbamoyladenylate synthase [Bacteroidota bacterium]